MRVEFFDGPEMVDQAFAFWQQPDATEIEYAASHGVSTEEFRRARELSQTYTGVHYDAIVSNSRALTGPHLVDARTRSRVMTAEEACAYVGLFLRARGDYTVHIEGAISQFLSLETFYTGAGAATIRGLLDRQLLSEHAFWDEGDNRRRALLSAVGARFGRALLARDYVLVRSHGWDTDRTHHEVRFFFEAGLVSLAATYDVVARLINLVLELKAKRNAVSFAQERWRDDVVAHLRDDQWVADQLDPASQFMRFRSLISTLRNTLHSDVLDDVVSLSGEGLKPHDLHSGRHAQTISVTDGDAYELAHALKDAEAEEWGISFIGSLDSGPLVANIDIQKFQRQAFVFTAQSAADWLARVPDTSATSAARERVRRIRAEIPPAADKFGEELRLLVGLGSRIRHVPESRNSPGLPD